MAPAPAMFWLPVKGDGPVRTYTPGAKDVVVTAQDKTSVQAREAFTYDDSPDGYRGGLSGGALNGQLNFTTITEDQTANSGDAVSALAVIYDVDLGAVQGIAVSATDSGKCNQSQLCSQM